MCLEAQSRFVCGAIGRVAHASNKLDASTRAHRSGTCGCIQVCFHGVRQIDDLLVVWCLQAPSMRPSGVNRCNGGVEVPSRSIGAARHLYHSHLLLLKAQLDLPAPTRRCTLVCRRVQGRKVGGASRPNQHGRSGVATSGLPGAP